MKKETAVASENMKKFFDKLCKLKEFIKEKADETGDDTIIEIYERLDEIFKIEENK
jgi:hypothetical protein